MVVNDQLNKVKENPMLNIILKEIDELKLLIQNRNGKRWLNLRESSDYCGLSPSTLRRAIRRGVLKTSKSTGKLLFKRSDIDRWLRG